MPKQIHAPRNSIALDAARSPPKKIVAQQPVVKRIVVGKLAEHSGSWKVAFADFATAMMAFFLTMWLMGATTVDQRGGISQYFNNPTMLEGASPSPSPTVVKGTGGASKTPVRLGSDVEVYPKTARRDGKIEGSARSPKEEAIVMVIDGDADRERQQLQLLKSTLEEAISNRPALRQYADQILMDLTSEGLRVQLIDKENRSMFPLGSSELEPFGVHILEQLSSVIATVPNRISISGHTDSVPYQRHNYGNWELSIDRANAARRALLAGGLSEDKIGRVVGMSTFAPLDREHLLNPINRRISIVVLNRSTEHAIVQESGSILGIQTAVE